MNKSKFFNVLIVVMTVLSMTFGALGSTPALAATSDFQILSLTGNNAFILEHNMVTGDDRGGIAVSGSQVFYSGDNQTGRFAIADVSGGTAVGALYDGLASNLATGEVYTLATDSGPIFNNWEGGPATVTRLLPIDGNTGSLTGQEITLSAPIAISMDSGTNSAGIFAGYGRIMLHNGTNVYEIALPSGQVTDLGAMTTPAHTYCENWAYWGVTEHFGGEDYIAYVQDSGTWPWNTIVRTRVSDGETSTVAALSSLSDMCSFTVSPSNNRWYFHHEGNSQFGGYDESIGYADATFTTSPAEPTAPAAFGKVGPEHGTTGLSTSPSLSWDAADGATSYEYCIDADKNNTCDSAWTSVDASTSVDLSELSYSKSYSWQVRAVNADGTTEANDGTWWHFATTSAPVHTLTVTANAQTMAYGDVDPEFTFTYSGFEGLDDASVLTQEPTCSVIEAYFGDAGAYNIGCANGDDEYYTFNYVGATLTVNKAMLTVTADDQSMTAGDADPAFTASYAGFIGLDAEGDLDSAPVCSVDVPHADPGEYPITCSGGSDNNYDFDYVAGTLTVNAAEPTLHTVTLNSTSMYDGWVRESTETSNKGGYVYKAHNLRVGDTVANQQLRSIVHFDTSSLPEGAVITSVTLKIKATKVVGANPFGKLGNIQVGIQQGAFSNNPNLQLADFQAAPSLKTAGIILNTPDQGWYSVDLDAGALSLINLDGATQFRLQFQKDDNNNRLDNFIQFYSGNAIETDRPQLIIEYTLP